MEVYEDFFNFKSHLCMKNQAQGIQSSSENDRKQSIDIEACLH